MDSRYNFDGRLWYLMRYLSVKTYFEAIEVGSTDNGIHFRSPRTTPVFLAPNKVKIISNDGNYFINKATLKC